MFRDRQPNMPTVTAEKLVEIGTRTFTAAGVSSAVARQVVESLVLSNLVGVDSHGVALIPSYLQAIEAGWIVPDAELEVLSNNGVAVSVDGRHGFGQIVARRAMTMAIENAKARVVGVVSFTHVYHIGRLGEYAALAAENGFIGFVIANGSIPGGMVAPFGGRQRVLGTNPISFAVPAAERPALVADFSTSTVAERRVRTARASGEKIPVGWIIDRDGRPTTNPADLYDGGALLCFGEHKGFALSLMVEVLAGILSGANTPVSPNYDRMQNGVFLLAINPDFFQPIATFRNTVDHFFDVLARVSPALGAQRVVIPGEPEVRSKASRGAEGIPVDDSTWAELLKLATGHLECQ